MQCSDTCLLEVVFVRLLVFSCACSSLLRFLFFSKLFFSCSCYLLYFSSSHLLLQVFLSCSCYLCIFPPQPLSPPLTHLPPGGGRTPEPFCEGGPVRPPSPPPSSSAAGACAHVRVGRPAQPRSWMSRLGRRTPARAVVPCTFPRAGKPASPGWYC